MRVLTPKQESFCQRYLETGNASEAYRLCYSAEKAKPETVNRSAKELLDNPKIAARLSELRAEALVGHSVTVASLLKELEEARLVAMKKRQGAAMVQATMGKAKLAGLEKGGDPDDTPTPASVTVEVKSGRKNANP
ncbi:terminase small subunit [Stenotrophomonas geniculata]|uniref:terminase small subunit n=1 Tax=Stenotrophomonas geniculata TaxID=86188 RepID=UPI002E7918C7|nr:terminase small subunit [Stenotrophomonas geniculata]